MLAYRDGILIVLFAFSADAGALPEIPQNYHMCYVCVLNWIFDRVIDIKNTNQHNILNHRGKHLTQ